MRLNLTGPGATTGYGVCTLSLLKSFDEEGFEPAFYPLGGQELEPEQEELVKRALGRAQFFDNRAPSLRVFHQWALAQHVGKGVHAAFPIFELDTFTAVEKHHLSAQDVLFVCSKWAKGVIEANRVKTPTFVVPFGVRHEVFKPCPLPPADSPTVFLHCAKNEVRKGFYDVLEGFRLAFTAADDVLLVLHCHNPFMQPDRADGYNKEWLGFVDRHPLRKKIVVSPGRFRTQQEVAALMQMAHCGLFPSRAEGWNLELSEMLAMGRYCIATDYSGHTEFASPSFCQLISPGRLVPAYDGVYFHGQGRWADFGEDQLEQLVVYMREIHQKKQEGTLSLNERGVQGMQNFTWRKAALRIAEVLRGTHEV